MKALLPALLSCTLLGPPALAVDRFSIDSRHTFPFFEVSHMGFSTQRGRFNRTTGTVELDAAARRGRIQVNIASDSIDMGLDSWDQQMRDDGFFDAGRHPTMQFTSDKLSFDGDVPIRAEGDLTLLGVTRPVTLDIYNFRCGLHLLLRKTVCGAEVRTTIRRSEFGMTRFLSMVGDEVRIFIPVEAFKD